MPSLTTNTGQGQQANASFISPLAALVSHVSHAAPQLLAHEAEREADEGAEGANPEEAALFDVQGAENEVAASLTWIELGGDSVVGEGEEGEGEGMPEGQGEEEEGGGEEGSSDDEEEESVEGEEEYEWDIEDVEEGEEGKGWEEDGASGTEGEEGDSQDKEEEGEESYSDSSQEEGESSGAEKGVPVGAEEGTGGPVGWTGTLSAPEGRGRPVTAPSYSGSHRYAPLARQCMVAAGGRGQGNQELRSSLKDLESQLEAEWATASVYGRVPGGSYENRCLRVGQCGGVKIADAYVNYTQGRQSVI